ncbi:hypothetical protein V8E53_006944 [Lactarius tabidus]
MVTLWNDNWLPTSITVAKVLAGVEVYLLSVVKSNSNSQGSNTKHALLMTTYSALFFFLSAAFSGLVLTNVFGEVAARAIQRGSGSKRSWVWATRHYMISLIVGTLSVISQLLLYGWLEESIFVKRRTLHRHGVRRAIPGPPRTTSVTRQTNVYNTQGCSLRPRDSQFSSSAMKAMVVLEYSSSRHSS